MLIVFVAAGVASGCLLYLTGRMLRKGIAFMENRPAPRERVGAFLILAAVLGAITGGLLYKSSLVIQECRATGEPVIPCVVFRR